MSALVTRGWGWLGGGLQSLVQNLVHDEFRRQITEVYDMK